MKCCLKLLAFTILALISLSVEAAVPLTSIYTDLWLSRNCRDGPPDVVE